jgi:hypothetical protein
MSKKSPYNRAFKNLDTPEKVYWFGFIVGDGCIYSNPNKVNYQFSIVSKDKEHLCKLAKFLGYPDTRVRVTKIKYFVLSLWCKELVFDLLNLGITWRKSNTVNASIISKNYVWDFIRGLWDADGSIMILKNKTVFSISLTGNYPLLKKIQQIIDYGGNLSEQKSKNKGADRLSYGGKAKTCYVLKKIYYNEPFLNRKYKQFLKIRDINEDNLKIDLKTGKKAKYIKGELKTTQYFIRECLYCGKTITVIPSKTNKIGRPNAGHFCCGSHAKLYYWKNKKKGVGNLAYNAV